MYLSEEATALRFTPTRVGKTLSFWRNCMPDAVHPHACGENRDLAADPPTLFGSPPRVWGKPA